MSKKLMQTTKRVKVYQRPDDNVIYLVGKEEDGVSKDKLIIKIEFAAHGPQVTIEGNGAMMPHIKKVKTLLTAELHDWQSSLPCTSEIKLYG